MNFLIDANLPRSLANTIREMGHQAWDVRDMGMGGAEDAQIARYAQTERLVIVTLDTDFGDIRNYPPSQYSGIIVVCVPADTAANLIVAVLEGFLMRDDLLAKVPGRLAIVEPGRVRMRDG